MICLVTNTFKYFLLFLLLHGIIPSLFAQQSTPDTGLVHLQTITGAIRPKSVVHNHQGKFFAQNMMYRHSITVYDRKFKLQKTISDEINFKHFGIKGFKGKHQGAPVEAAISPDGQYAWVSNYQMYGKGFDNPGSDNCAKSATYDKGYVYKINTEQLRIEKVLQAGCVPKHLACSPDGQLLLVSNWCSGDVSIFDARADSLLTTIGLGKYPRGIAIDSRSRFAYVAVMGSAKIARIDLASFKVRLMEKVGRTPRHICLSPDDKYLYVSLNAEGKVLKYDLGTLKLLKAKSVGTTPRSMVLSPGGRFLYVVNYKDNQMTKLKTADMTIVQRIKTNAKPIGITLDEQEQTVWVACYTGSLMVFKDHSMDLPMRLTQASVLLNRAYFPFFAPTPVFGETTPLPTLASSTTHKGIAAPKTGYCIVLGSFQEKTNASKAQKSYTSKGIETQIIPSERGNRLTYGAFPNRNAAQKALQSLDIEGWVLKLE